MKSVRVFIWQLDTRVKFPFTGSGQLTWVHCSGIATDAHVFTVITASYKSKNNIKIICQ